ncbi:hypothetical protein IPF37_04680 [bacterium]|nr:MAG: hypothetical protein IPF37_04680 [bacterium]
MKSQQNLVIAHKFDQGFQEDLEKAQKALDAAKQKISEAKTQKDKADKDLAAGAAGPTAPPAGDGTPLENLNASLTALKTKLAQLGQALQHLQDPSKPIPTPAPKPAADKAALQQAVANADAALHTAKEAEAAAQKALTEAEKKIPAGTGLIATSEKDLKTANAIKIADDPSVVAAQEKVDVAQAKLTKWQAKHKKHTQKNLGKSKSTEDLYKSSKSSHAPKKIKEADDTTENKFNTADSQEWLSNLNLKDQATQNLKDARALLKAAKAVTGLNIQNKKKVAQARNEAQKAIKEAVAAQKDNLNTFATKAHTAKTKAEHVKHLATGAETRRAAKKAKTEPTLQEARNTLARAKSIADVQDDATVQQAIAVAQVAIQEATQAHAGTKTKAFRTKAAAALKEAKAAETAAQHAKKKLQEQKVAQEAAAKEKAEAAAKVQAEALLKDARFILNQATLVANVQDKKSVIKAIEAAQQAIDQADAQKDNAQMRTTTAQAAKDQASVALTITNAAVPTRADKRAKAEQIFNQAQSLLAQAQGLAEVQNDPTVKAAIALASADIELAKKAQAETKVSNFRDQASAALIAAQQADNAANEAKQKFDSDQAAAKAAATHTAKEEQADQDAAKIKPTDKAKEDLVPGIEIQRAKPKRDQKLQGKKRKRRNLSNITITTPEEEANSLIQEINEFVDGVNSTTWIKKQADTAKTELETLKNTPDKDEQKIILNRITDLRTQILNAAATEKKRKEIAQAQKEKLAQQKAAEANALPGMITEAKVILDALNAMPANTPKYNKFSTFGKALEAAKINVENNYDALSLAQEDPTDQRAAKGLNMQKKKLEEIKKTYKEIYEKYKATGGDQNVALIPTP